MGIRSCATTVACGVCCWCRPGRSGAIGRWGTRTACTLAGRLTPAPAPCTAAPRFVECEPDVLRVALRPLQASGSGDAFVILGSDGLWDVMSDEDAVHCAKRALQVGGQGRGKPG